MLHVTACNTLRNICLQFESCKPWQDAVGGSYDAETIISQVITAASYSGSSLTLGSTAVTLATVRVRRELRNLICATRQLITAKTSSAPKSSREVLEGRSYTKSVTASA
ncbi:uncharacterized protein [Physcomitrium patens]|uniref:uncharacterized protein n=1 Tax=Physcomitrium patens TaxID=3218 RepID=UPI000D17D182|nr:uncharacterized protein LOC112275676 [Physcomitrium patens]|eukprot:XP_024362005.1 uncharacterized protein LOC112275676 [Physcomitrella patens]